MTLRAALASCWILHRRAWRESSVIIDLLTREHGRLSLVARGARKPRSAWRGMTEPFQPLRASFTLRGEMGTLTGLESRDAAPGLKESALWCGFYANELLLRLLPRQEPAPELFDMYSNTLLELVHRNQRGVALRRFELALLTETGVAPELIRDARTGEPVAADQWYRLPDETGPVLAAGPGRGCYPGRVFLALAAGMAGDPQFDERETRRGAREVMRRLLAFHLGDKPLYTRSLLARGET